MFALVLALTAALAFVVGWVSALVFAGRNVSAIVDEMDRRHGLGGHPAGDKPASMTTPPPPPPGPASPSSARRHANGW